MEYEKTVVVENLDESKFCVSTHYVSPKPVG